MSQKVIRKGPTTDEKEKRQTDSPVKDIKKKMVTNAEKEKQATEKSGENVTEKKSAEKSENSVEKSADKNNEKIEKKAEGDKVNKDDAKGEKSGKADKADKELKKAEPKPKQNGRDRPHNGVSDVTLASNGSNGNDEVLNGTVGGESDEEDVMLVIDDQDELFPELTYDDTSDVDFEPPTPENGPSRSFTRRSQVKATRTPETPRPASDKPADRDTAHDDSKEPKNKPKEGTPTPSDRKLRSADSPKPEGKKGAAEKTPESAKKTEKAPETPKKTDKAHDSKKVQDKQKTESKEKGKENGNNLLVVDLEEDGGQEPPEPRQKTDTNYSKSRVKVSPYRRSERLHDITLSSVAANYTGNNSTMEMDITETSMGSAAEDGNYLSVVRNMRGRRSYRLLPDMPDLSKRRKSRTSTPNVSVSDAPKSFPERPTGTVVGRKRKTDSDQAEDFLEMVGANVEMSDANLEITGAALEMPGAKRMRLMERLVQPFRRATTQFHVPRPTPEIVGINTDLPMSAPVASPASNPLPPLKVDADPNKRCVIM